MKCLLAFALFLTSTPLFAANHCEAYAGRPRYLNAIETVAKAYDLNLEGLCTSEKFIGIEAQPSRKISYEGEVIPHINVQLHRSYDSCFYFVRDRDLTITDQGCYSGF